MCYVSLLAFGHWLLKCAAMLSATAFSGVKTSVSEWVKVCLHIQRVQRSFAEDRCCTTQIFTRIGGVIRSIWKFKAVVGKQLLSVAPALLGAAVKWRPILFKNHNTLRFCMFSSINHRWIYQFYSILWFWVVLFIAKVVKYDIDMFASEQPLAKVLLDCSFLSPELQKQYWMPFNYRRRILNFKEINNQTR